MRRRHLLVTTLATVLLANGVGAAPAADMTVLQGGRIIDGKGGAPVENGALVIRAGRIASVLGPDAPVPTGATIIDVSGKTLMPALIAGHAHLGLTEGDQSGAAHITESNVLHQLQKYQRYGIGSVASFGTDHAFIYALRDRRRQGQLATPTILTAGRGFGVPGGAPPVAMGMDQVYRPATPAQVAQEMDELAQNQPDLVKIWVDDFGKTLKKMVRRSTWPSSAKRIAMA